MKSLSESRWLVCEDPTPMLVFLREKASERKLRLFAVACCRHICNLIPEKPGHVAVKLAGNVMPTVRMCAFFAAAQRAGPPPRREGAIRSGRHRRHETAWYGSSSKIQFAVAGNYYRITERLQSDR